MLDFMKVSTRQGKSGIEVYPEFIIKKTKDLMIKGGDFYAIWDEENKSWSTDSYRAVELMDNDIRAFTEDLKSRADDRVKPLYLHNSSSKMIDAWNHYVTSQAKDNWHQLDESIIFSNDDVDRKNYSSHRLDYPLQEGSHDAYDELISTLYDDEERHKLEWAIGAIISGDSKKIQKFVVLYGSGGTGKSTFLNIVQMLFDGYYAVFDAKSLGSSNATFALESFRSNPLVAIQHDGDLSKIEDNTRLNSLVSHEQMEVNEKYKSAYTSRFNAFCFMGTNKPVKITDAKSGIIRRLIDVNPTGQKVSMAKYKQLYSQIKFELPGIAWHCLKVYEEDPGYYDNYIPVSMIGASNDFFNFIDDSYEIFKKADHTTLAIAWPMYNDYCAMAKVAYPYSMRAFKEELKNYFKDFVDRGYDVEGNRVRNYYDGFLSDKFDYIQPNKGDTKPALRFEYSTSLLDHMLATQPAQYGGDDEKPHLKWSSVTTKLEDLDTKKLHYVKIPHNHIIVDFDLKDKDGNKSFALNLEAASHFPLTYAELSKSGQGIHLHYIWDGDPDQLSSLYDEDIEIKVFKGNASLRRKVSLCNNVPVKTISTGLPLKGDKQMVDFQGFENDKHLRRCILKALRKEVFPNTRPNIDYIHHCLETAFNQGLKYDCSDMHSAILGFAAESTHQADYCLRKVADMKFRSEEPSEDVPDDNSDDLVFFDIEVYPNLLLVCYKKAGEGKECIRLFNPTPDQVERLCHYKLVGFNCRRYDNHILYARLLGYDNQQIYELSAKIIDAEKKAGLDSGFFAEAYNISYTDVYDYASAPNKQSLKKYEIQLGLPHKEMELDWNQPAPEELWDAIADYCCNDVLATEAVHNYLADDFQARKILAKMANKSVNTSTNSLTSIIIFGDNKEPQNEFFYRDLSKPVKREDLPADVIDFYEYKYKDKLPVPFSEESYLPYFPGYKYNPLGKKGERSTYKGQFVGEGGWVYAKPGIYKNVALLDIASMHPHSLMAECHFGPRYTLRFKEIVDTRIYIKHDDMDACKNVLNGLIAPFIESADFSPKKLSTALKTPINAVYGLSSASFDNRCRNPENKDNIVAKRGALFMVDLKEAVEAKGYTVAHIKTDSIKIPDADDYIIDFVMEFGKRYGYTFEHEATYERMCLINDSTYIAKHDGKWEAVAAQFQEPFVFKTCFSHEPLELSDYFQTKAVKTSIFLDYGDKKKFVGKVGSFLPVTKHGGQLVAQRLDKDGNVKYDSVTGCKDYLWAESTDVVENHWEDYIDMSYYRNLVDKARDAINQYGNYEDFVSDNPLPDWLSVPDDAPEPGIPFDNYILKGA